MVFVERVRWASRCKDAGSLASVASVARWSHVPAERSSPQTTSASIPSPAVVTTRPSSILGP